MKCDSNCFHDSYNNHNSSSCDEKHTATSRIAYLQAAPV